MSKPSGAKAELLSRLYSEFQAKEKKEREGEEEEERGKDEKREERRRKGKEGAHLPIQF